MPGGAQHALEWLELFFSLQIDCVLVQHLGYADDRIQRRAQFVRHVGEKLRFQLARDLELPALGFNLLEQSRVLYAENRL